MAVFTRVDADGAIVERRPATAEEVGVARRNAAEAKLAAEASVAATIAAAARRRAGEPERRRR